jgi:hypothetical protein
VAALKGTQTEKNILTAFAGESQARNRYSYFASQAKKEGYVQISVGTPETATFFLVLFRSGASVPFLKAWIKVKGP